MPEFEAIIFHAFTQREIDRLTRNAYDAYVVQGVACYIGFTYGKGESYTQTGPDGSM